MATNHFERDSSAVGETPQVPLLVSEGTPQRVEIGGDLAVVVGGEVDPLADESGVALLERGAEPRRVVRVVARNAQAVEGERVVLVAAQRRLRTSDAAVVEEDDRPLDRRRLEHQLDLAGAA